MEKYPNENKQPETAYERPKLYMYLRELSQAERHVLRTDTTEQYNELGVLLDAINQIDSQDPNQYEIDLEVGNGEV